VREQARLSCSIPHHGECRRLEDPHASKPAGRRVGVLNRYGGRRLTAAADRGDRRLQVSTYATERDATRAAVSSSNALRTWLIGRGALPLAVDNEENAKRWNPLRNALLAHLAAPSALGVSPGISGSPPDIVVANYGRLRRYSDA
jgi:hypothetical protein